MLLNEAHLRHFTPLVQKVLAQTKARVFGGDRHFQGKALSLFEEHSQAICKGKAHKPTEFGRLVRRSREWHRQRLRGPGRQLALRRAR